MKACFDLNEVLDLNHFNFSTWKRKGIRIVIARSDKRWEGNMIRREAI